ncbi:MAG: class D beta-lactamase [Saprospiraceae bacterium]|nr:class D beta-lactamase [Saprospiraceae bacterium]
MKPITLPYFLLFLTVGFIACGPKESTEIRDDFKKYYDQYNVRGSFALYDEQAKKYTLYNKAQFTEPFSPASTFKICNSLIGLETGIIPDENFVIPWDSIVRNPVWDKDHDLKTAFKNSTVWYYQELARRVGDQQMKYWIDKARYGNMDTTGGLDKFWLYGGLRITPQQQIDFLQRLHDNNLPFSQRSMDIVKKIMIVKDSTDYVLRAKSGWGMRPNEDIGWNVGYLETNGKVYYFTNCVQADSTYMSVPENTVGFDHARSEIVNLVLQDLGLIKQ